MLYYCTVFLPIQYFIKCDQSTGSQTTTTVSTSCCSLHTAAGKKIKRGEWCDDDDMTVERVWRWMMEEDIVGSERDCDDVHEWDGITLLTVPYHNEVTFLLLRLSFQQFSLHLHPNNHAISPTKETKGRCWKWWWQWRQRDEWWWSTQNNSASCEEEGRNSRRGPQHDYHRCETTSAAFHSDVIFIPWTNSEWYRRLEDTIVSGILDYTNTITPWQSRKSMERLSGYLIQL